MLSGFDFSLSPLDEEFGNSELGLGKGEVGMLGNSPFEAALFKGEDVDWNSAATAARGSLSPHSDSSASPPALEDPEYLDLLQTLQATGPSRLPPPPSLPSLSPAHALSEGHSPSAKPALVKAEPKKAAPCFTLGLTPAENRQLVTSLGGNGFLLSSTDSPISPAPPLTEHASLIRQRPGGKTPQLRILRTSPANAGASQDAEPPTKKPRVVTAPPRPAIKPRSPSPTPSEAETVTSNWGQSNSKQAVYAKQYRAANKKRMSEMEVTIKRLEAENRRLKGQVDSFGGKEAEYRDEISYLRSVLANDSAIATIVGGVQSTVSGRLTVAFPSPDEATSSTAASSATAKKPASKASPTTRSAAKRKSTLTAGLGASGVCLHVQDGGVSLEFCGKCNARSRSDATSA